MARIAFVDAADAPYIRVVDLMAGGDSDADEATRERLRDEAERLDVRFLFKGGPDTLQLFETRCEPDTQIQNHAHHEPEIIYITEGEIHFGKRVYPAGSAVSIPGGTLYGFRAGPDGMSFLNFRARADFSYLTRDDLMTARHGAPQPAADPRG